MEICCCICGLSNSDIIQIITAAILLLTLLAIVWSNYNNTKINQEQVAENIIIKQIEFHYIIRNGIELVGYKGQGAFTELYIFLKEKYLSMPGYYNNTEADEEKKIYDSFTALYLTYGSHFGNYFKNLYYIVKNIDELPTNDKVTKEFYINLIKAQLSKFEILLLAYDCIWIQDNPPGKNFIDFARKYDLLSALETNELIVSKSSISHKDIFKNKYGIIFGKPIDFTN
jgi:hypothetical protein